jgi:hypothetical protein
MATNQEDHHFLLIPSIVHYRKLNMNKVFCIFVLIFIASFYISCQKRLRPEEKAIRLVEESNTFEGDLPVRLSIDTWIKLKGNEVRPIGWEVTRKEDQICLVAYKYKIYSFREGSGERGFFFEVNLATEAVRNVTQIMAREIGSLDPPLKDEDGISDQLFQEWVEKENLLSGANP